MSVQAAPEAPGDARRTPPLAPGHEPPAPQPRQITLVEAQLATAAVISAVAGGMHLKAAIEHAPHWWVFGVLFALTGVAQVAWAWVVHRGRAGVRTLMLGVWGSLAIVAVWVLSRTLGFPFGPWAGDAEPPGAIDVVATFDELAVAAIAFAVARPAGRVAARLRWLNAANAMRVGVMLGSASFMAAAIGGHSH